MVAKEQQETVLNLSQNPVNMGQKVALFGRKINLAEDQQLIVKTMRDVVNGMTSTEGVSFITTSLKKRKLNQIDLWTKI